MRGHSDASRLFSLAQRLGMSKLLEDNKKLGPRRVDSWRLSRSLEEVNWVFSKLCAGVPSACMDAGLSSWAGDECAYLVRERAASSELRWPRPRRRVACSCSGPLPLVCLAAPTHVLGHSHSSQVRNLGLGQYAASFAFNLRGSRLPSLRMTELAQLGVEPPREAAPRPSAAAEGSPSCRRRS